MNQNQQDIDEFLLLQYLQGNADEALRASVEAWLNADSRNKKQLDRLESLWLESGKIAPAPVAVNIEDAWARLSDRIAKFENQPFIKESDNGEPKIGQAVRQGRIIGFKNSGYLWKAAAVVVLLVGMYTLFYLFLRTPQQIYLSSGNTVLHDTLPDGSKITLNLSSNLTFPEKFEPGSRKVKLNGEAFFEVKPDASQHFIVDAGPAIVVVLGTSFIVKTHPIQVANNPVTTWGDPARVLEVDVIHGRVRLSTINKSTGDTASVILETGQTGIVEPGSLQPVIIGADLPDNMFWVNRSLDFRRTPMSEVLALLQKHYPVIITVSDPAILECRLTATFVGEPPGKILSIIAASFGLSLEAKGNEYRLTGIGCGSK